MEAQENKTAVPTREQARDSLLGRMLHREGNREGNREGMTFGGMPFHWAAGFACLCLASLFLGHWITIRGQEMINIMSQKQQPIYAPQTPVIKVEPQSSQKTDHALGSIANSLDGTSQNLNKLVDAVNAKFAKVQESIVILGSKIEAMPKDNSAPVDLTDIKTALASLHNTMADTKNVDVIVSSIKETSQRQDQAFRTLTSTVAELQKTVKEKSAAEELKVNSTLGEKFPPKK
jgi:hypothetical protein